MNDQELADAVLVRPAEFSPALSIRPGDDDDQVFVEIVMSRTPNPNDLGDTPRAVYRALIKPSMDPSGATLIHLISEGSETSLCGIPRAQFETAKGVDEVVCPECIGWLPKQMASRPTARRIGRG